MSPSRRPFGTVIGLIAGGSNSRCLLWGILSVLAHAGIAYGATQTEMKNKQE